MSESLVYPDQFPEQFTPGLTITVRSQRDLRNFEEDLIHVVDEEYDRDLWKYRTPLNNLVRPYRFQGNLDAVTLTVMDEPFEQFLVAQAAAKREPATVKFNRGDGRPVDIKRNFLHYLCAPLMSNFIGFHFLSHANSGRVDLGPLSSDIWFGPIATERKGREAYAGEAVVRIVTLPNYDAEAFGERLKSSITRGKATRQGTQGGSRRGMGGRFGDH